MSFCFLVKELENVSLISSSKEVKIVRTSVVKELFDF